MKYLALYLSLLLPLWGETQIITAASFGFNYATYSAPQRIMGVSGGLTFGYTELMGGASPINITCGIKEHAELSDQLDLTFSVQFTRAYPEKVTLGEGTQNERKYTIGSARFMSPAVGIEWRPQTPDSPIVLFLNAGYSRRISGYSIEENKQYPNLEGDRNRVYHMHFQNGMFISFGLRLRLNLYYDTDYERRHPEEWEDG